MSTDFKQTLWKTADKLRAQMDAGEYKHIVLGLIFLKYISDTFVNANADGSINRENLIEVRRHPLCDLGWRLGAPARAGRAGCVGCVG